VKKSPFLFFVFFTGFASGYFAYEQNLPEVFSSTNNTPTLNVCFSPKGQCEKLAIRAIKSAQKEILIQAYSFTSKPIANELIKASKSGIVVKVLFDRSQLKAPYSQIHRLKKEGIKTIVDYVNGIAHNKTIIIDRARLVTGSYNFSKSANTKNSENMLYIKDKNLAKIYKDQWLQRSRKQPTQRNRNDRTNNYKKKYK